MTAMQTWVFVALATSQRATPLRNVEETGTVSSTTFWFAITLRGVASVG